MKVMLERKDYLPKYWNACLDLLEQFDDLHDAVSMLIFMHDCNQQQQEDL